MHIKNHKEWLLMSIAIPLFMLGGCSSSKEKSLIEQYQENSFAAQKDARACVDKIMRHESISSEFTCKAIIAYKKPICKEHQQAGALYYQGYDCNNDNEILMMTFRGD